MYIVDTHQHEGGGGVQVDHCRPGNLEREVGRGRRERERGGRGRWEVGRGRGRGRGEEGERREREVGGGERERERGGERRKEGMIANKVVYTYIVEGLSTGCVVEG